MKGLNLSLFRDRFSDEHDLQPSTLCWHEEEKEALRESLHSLQVQFAAERSRREAAEREAELLLGENTALEQQLGAMEGCKVLSPVKSVFFNTITTLWK